RNGIPYRWGNPHSLQATKDGKLHRITDAAEFQTLLHALGLSLMDHPKLTPITSTLLECGEDTTLHPYQGPA
ncbi:Hypothetical predicted protein, partial [Pelobates cultripes]